MGMGQMGNYNIPAGYTPVAEPWGNTASYPRIQIPNGGMINATDHAQLMRRTIQNAEGKRSVSGWDMLKQFGKGLLSPITSLFSSPKAFLLGAGVMAVSAALMFATAGAAGPMLLGLGLGVGCFQVGKAAYKLINATNAQDLKDACYQAGAAASTLGLSCLGAKQSLRWATELQPERIDNMTTLTAVGKNIKSIPDSISKSFSVFKNRQAYSNFKAGLSNTRNLFRPTVRLRDISELLPEVKRQQSRAVILDWDNTVMAIGEKSLRPDTLKALKALQEYRLPNSDQKLQIGIVSNNPFPGRIKFARNLLSENGLDIPIVWDSVKPCKIGFVRMFAEFQKNDPMLDNFSQVAMVGDGLINDMFGGNLLNMKTMHAKWFRNGIAAKSKACLFDMIGHIVNPILRAFSPYSKAEYFPVHVKTNA